MKPDLFSETKTKQEPFYIGKGSLVTRDMCIPINAISSITVTEPSKVPLFSSLIFIAFGLFFSFHDQSVFVKTVGILILISSVIILLLSILANLNRTAQLRIQLHSGRFVTFSCKNSSFLQDLMKQFCDCIHDKDKIVFVDMEKQSVSYGAGNMRTLSDAEWLQLERFFQIRKREFQENDPGYRACARMEEYAGKKDSSRLKAYMKESGIQTVKSVLGQNADRTVTALLAIILKTE